jgi:glycosyltransferase involved in cell wall biosynthesis
VVGRDWHDPSTGKSYMATMRQLAAQVAPGHVSFLGAVNNNDLPILLSTASVCVMPSHSEAMGMARLEALSTGRPLVVGRTGAGPEVVEDGVSGLLCDPHDPQSIASCVSTLLAAPALRERLGQGARRRAVERFSAEAVAVQNEKFYRRCVEGALHKSVERDFRRLCGAPAEMCGTPATARAWPHRDPWFPSPQDPSLQCFSSTTPRKVRST